MANPQIYLVTTKAGANLVQAKNPNDAIGHVFNPHVRRLSAAEAMQLSKTMTLEIAGEVAPLDQQQLPLDGQS